jgi:hypothetical protein
MKYLLFLIFGIISTLKFNSTNSLSVGLPIIYKYAEKANPEIKDTCILYGFVFEMTEYKAPNPLTAKIKNGRIHIFDLQGQEKNLRVIRYVFSVRSDDRVSSVRHYGDLVSYPVLQILKDAQIEEPYYFEEIIIVDENKEIQNNAVRPIIIKRIAH